MKTNILTKLKDEKQESHDGPEFAQLSFSDCVV